MAEANAILFDGHDHASGDVSRGPFQRVKDSAGDPDRIVKPGESHVQKRGSALLGSRQDRGEITIARHHGSLVCARPSENRRVVGSLQPELSHVHDITPAGAQRVPDLGRQGIVDQQR